MITKTNRKNSSTLQFVDIEDLVPKEHLVRKIEDSIDFEFIREKVAHLYSADKGRPSVDPVVLFKIIFIQYLFGIKSIRQTVKEIEVNVAYRWFLGFDFNDAIPHYSTFSKNYKRRFENSTIFFEIFGYILSQINEEGLINKESIFVDSTHTKAYANKKRIENRWLVDSANKYVRSLNEEINEIREIEGKKPLEPKIKKTIISKTDPECGMFHKGEKERQLAYSTQVACDKKGYVVGCKVNPGNLNDNNTAPEFLEELLEDSKLKNVVMDAGYTSPIVLNQIFEKGKIPVVPYARPKGMIRDNNPENPNFTASAYHYDLELKAYICPLGVLLDYRGLNSEGKMVFKSRTKDCKNCPLKSRCTNQKCKEIQRHLLEHASDMAKIVRLSPLGKELYPQRKFTIERCFAQTKFNNNLGFTFLRGLKKNQDRVLIIFAMHNLTKFAKMKWKSFSSYFKSLLGFIKNLLFRKNCSSFL